MILFRLIASCFLITTVLSCNERNENALRQDNVLPNEKKVFPNLVGEWHWGNDDWDFTLSLRQTDDSILGNYCAIAQAGSRVDCADSADEVSCTVHGQFLGDSVIVTYTSSWDDGTDTAVIRYSNSADSIYWSTQKNRIMSWVPARATLKRL